MEKRPVVDDVWLTSLQTALGLDIEGSGQVVVCLGHSSLRAFLS